MRIGLCSLGVFLLSLCTLGYSSSATNHTVEALDSAVDYAGQFQLICDPESENDCFAQTSDDITISFTGFAIYVFLIPSGRCNFRIDGNFVGTTDLDPNDPNFDLGFSDTDLSNEFHTLVISPDDEVEFNQVIFTSGETEPFSPTPSSSPTPPSSPTLPPSSTETTEFHTSSGSAGASITFSSLTQPSLSSLSASSHLATQTSDSLSPRPTSASPASSSIGSSTLSSSTSPSPSSSAATGLDVSSSHGKSQAGAIAGGVVGGIFLVFVLLGAVVFRQRLIRKVQISPFGVDEETASVIPVGQKEHQDLAEQLRAIETRFERLEQAQRSRGETPRAGGETVDTVTEISDGPPPTYEG
ncbi:hypothetical protein C8R44DRAFT_767682 [Mycena epipterygia]|nr:hypothetical protein C8R44DRAFT_767682 [Mycena epipterygia]